MLAMGYYVAMPIEDTEKLEELIHLRKKWLDDHEVVEEAVFVDEDEREYIMSFWEDEECHHWPSRLYLPDVIQNIYE